MSAIGIMLIGFGILTVWSGWELVNVFDILRSFIGAPSAPVDLSSLTVPGASSSSPSSASSSPSTSSGGGAPRLAK